MYREHLEKLELDEVATIIDRINPLFKNTEFDPLETTILAADLPFYEGYQILEVFDQRTIPSKTRFVVYSYENSAVLNFTNKPIYELNEKVPILLNESNIYDYTRFFFTFVRGRHGRFIITENVDEIAWRDDPSPNARKSLSKLITPIMLEGTDEKGVYTLSICVIFKDSLFKSKVFIDMNGNVKLSDEELLIEDLPVQDDNFGL